MATSYFINDVYNDGFAPEFSVSMLKEITMVVWDYAQEAGKWRTKVAEKYKWNWNMKTGFLWQDSQSSYSFAKIQNLGGLELPVSISLILWVFSLILIILYSKFHHWYSFQEKESFY